MPLDIRVYNNGSLKPANELRVEKDDPYYQMISHAWGDALKASLVQLPDFEFNPD